MSLDPATITLTVRQREELARLAAVTGKPWSEILTEALNTYRGQVNENGSTGDETPFEKATRLGLIGGVSTEFSDLATNPRHMEGFGQS